MKTSAERAERALEREFKCPDCGCGEFFVYRTNADPNRRIRRCKGKVGTDDCGRSWEEKDDDTLLGDVKPVVGASAELEAASRS